MTLRPTSLRIRIVLGFIVTAIFTSALFGLMAFILAYNVEDRIFAGAVGAEVEIQQMHWEKHQQLSTPSREYMRIYRKVSELPDDLKSQFVADDLETEFFGTEGRYYHVSQFTLPRQGGRAIVVAEVGPYLVVRPRRATMIAALIVLSIIVALFSGMAGYFLASRAVAPLSELAADVARNDGETIPAIDGSGYRSKEVAALALGLENAFDRVRSFVARERAFTRDASHELRTPLAVIRSGAELLLLNGARDGHASAPIQRIEAAADDMTLTLDLLLTLAREDGAPQVTAPLLPLVEKSVFYASARFAKSNIRVAVDIQPHQQVSMNPVVVQLILNNIVGNAFQHANESMLTISGNGQTLLITDTGPGLRESKVSAPFKKGASSTGDGLGLSIVRRLCDQSRITLCITTNDGAGTQFKLDFNPSATPQ